MKTFEINLKKESKFPEDYHTDVYENYYKGQLVQSNGKPYSSSFRKKYYSPNERENKHFKHIAPGHWHGYRFIIQNYTNIGDTIFDPCAGSGTVLVEAINNQRNAVGIEIEYGEIAIENCKFQNSKNNFTVYKEDIRNIDKILPKDSNFSLIITGTPYNNNSDAPERKKLGGENITFNYNKQLPNLAWLKDKEYYETLKEIYNKCINYLKLNGYFCIIIKDTIRNKTPYLLHKHLTEILLETKRLELKAVYLHKHHPPTLFISTYNKIWKTNIKVPKYQTIVVLKKIK